MWSFISWYLSTHPDSARLLFQVNAATPSPIRFLPSPQTFYLPSSSCEEHSTSSCIHQRHSETCPDKLKTLVIYAIYSFDKLNTRLSNDTVREENRSSFPVYTNDPCVLHWKKHYLFIIFPIQVFSVLYNICLSSGPV